MSKPKCKRCKNTSTLPLSEDICLECAWYGKGDYNPQLEADWADSDAMIVQGINSLPNAYVDYSIPKDTPTGSLIEWAIAFTLDAMGDAND